MIEDTLLLILVLGWPACGIAGWLQALDDMNEFAKKLGQKGTHPEPSDFVMIPLALFLGPITFVANSMNAFK